MNKKTVIGRLSLVIAAMSDDKLGAQIFNYTEMREIRADINKLEVTVLMTYDKDYYRVFSITPKNETPESMSEAKGQVMKFYNDLLNAAMQFSKEDFENMKKNQEAATKNVEPNNSTPVTPSTVMPTADTKKEN